MVSVVVYGDRKSTCTQRILILLEELSLKYTLEPIDLYKGEHKQDTFLEMQPFGKIPVVKYDNRVLFESRSILRYIAKNNVEIEDLLGGTDVDMWLEAEAQNFHPCASTIVYEMVFRELLKAGPPDAVLVKQNVKRLESVLDVYERRLGQTKFIAGESFSIADISHIPYIVQLLHCGYKSVFRKRPNVYRWLKRIVKRDSVEWVCKAKLQESDKPNIPIPLDAPPQPETNVEAIET